jgi:tetratricopeptide (TPR) repeat protein
LHDREEYVDALSMYCKALEMQRHVVQNHTNDQHPNAHVDVITTLCNVGRIHHLLGDLENALRVNKEVVRLAMDMVSKSHSPVSGSNQEPHPSPEAHDFVRNRMISLGNLYVEAGRLEEAMQLFTRIARSQGLDSMLSFRPEGSDIDTGSFAVRAAERMGKLGLQAPHAAAA